MMFLGKELVPFLIMDRHWLHGLWPASWQTYNIAVLELFPIVIALHIWGSQIADRCVIFFSDDAAVVNIINKQTSKHTALMVLLRDLVLSCLRHNILFRARHIPGRINSRADYLSRSRLQSSKNYHQTQTSSHLIDRGYPEGLVQRTLSEVNFENRKQALLPKPKAHKRILPFVTQYHPAVPNVKQILMKHWHLIEEQPLLKEIFKEPPLISYKKGRSLKDILVRSKL